MGNVGIKKKLFNFLHKTNFNVELQESNSMNLANIIFLHINSIQYSFNIYIKAKTSCGKHEVLIWMDLKSHGKCRNKIQRICIHL